MKTFISDLHGTLVVHQAPEEYGQMLMPLDGAIEWTCQVYRAGHKLIIMTGAPDAYYDRYLNQLTDMGFVFSELIMECGSGDRILINDRKPYDDQRMTAYAFNKTRDSVELPSCE